MQKNIEVFDSEANHIHRMLTADDYYSNDLAAQYAEIYTLEFLPKKKCTGQNSW